MVTDNLDKCCICDRPARPRYSLGDHPVYLYPWCDACWLEVLTLIAQKTNRLEFPRD